MERSWRLPAVPAVENRRLWSLGEVSVDEPLTEEESHEIEPESYFWDGFSIVDFTEIEFTVEVLEGPSINVFVLDSANQSAFEEGESFEAVEGSVDMDVGYIENPGLELEGGEYALIMYNGEEEPDNA